MKCKFCGISGLNWNYTDAGWHMDNPDGSYHACKGTKYLDQELVQSIYDSTTESDLWLAQAFVKRLALFRYLYPRATISPQTFINGTLSDRQYLRQCSDKAFRQIMLRGNTGIMQKRHAKV
jgi:hypothetical protein